MKKILILILITIGLFGCNNEKIDRDITEVIKLAKENPTLIDKEVNYNDGVYIIRIKEVLQKDGTIKKEYIGVDQQGPLTMLKFLVILLFSVITLSFIIGIID